MKNPRFVWNILILWSLVFSWNSGARADAIDCMKITAPEVKEIIEKNQGVLIHLLSKIEFEMQHIPGSINVPIVEIQTTNQLPKDKNVPLVFYCMGLR